MMPVYEYFCPRCSRELEVLSSIRSADAYSDCPDCGGKAWRLLSGFGSRTGSYLQPAGTPFRDESGWQASRGTVVAAITKSDVDAGSLAEDQQASLAVEMSWLLESQPNGSNIWFIQDWGIASMLRYLREELDLEPTEAAAASLVEGPVDLAAGIDQRIEYTSVSPWPDERIAEPAKAMETGARPMESPVDFGPGVDQLIKSPSVKPWADEESAEAGKATKSDTRSADVPVVAYAEPRVAYWSREPAMVTRPEGRARGALGRHWLPTSYFGWFMLMVASIAAVVVPLVWILAVAA